MKAALLTLHPSNFASCRLKEEALSLKLDLTVIDPSSLVLSHAAKSSYDVTLNRISVVEMNEFYSALLHQHSWGKQVNPLALKLLWRDKAHQLLWLAQNDFQTIPFMGLRGKPESSELEEFLSGEEWVLKMNRGQRGIGVHLLNRLELKAWLETLYRLGDQDFIIQPRLKVINEWRVNLIGLDFLCVLKRDHQSGKANAHTDQRVEWMREVPSLLRDLIEHFKQKVSFDYLALDVLEDESGLYINDLNTTMGFEQLEKITSYNVARLLLEQSIRASH